MFTRDFFEYKRDSGIKRESMRERVILDSYKIKKFCVLFFCNNQGRERLSDQNDQVECNEPENVKIDVLDSLT